MSDYTILYFHNRLTVKCAECKELAKKKIDRGRRVKMVDEYKRLPITLQEEHSDL